ncbi:hypothetical protein Asfd1_238 [Aeromonas phage Asfd_1]|nr:hypothetical protein Asfd1_238 [Aeromonas phage Asfd_1]
MFDSELKNKLHNFIMGDNIDLSLRGMVAYRACMSAVFGNKESPLYSTTRITQPERWVDKNFNYSSFTAPVRIDGPIWESCFPMMFPTILREKFGYVMINEYSLADIIDTLKEMRKEYKKQQALFHLEWLQSNQQAPSDLNSKMGSAQYACKAILNCLYGYLLTRSDFNNIDFEMAVQEKFDFAAKTIIENGGTLLHASVDSFIYKADLPITFDENQHNDKFSNVLIFQGGYAADIGKSSRLRTNSQKVLDRILCEQKRRFLK